MKSAVIRGARPASVTGAVKLLYATLVIGIVRSMLEFQSLAEAAPMEFILTVWVLTVTIMLAFIYCVSTGRNWARIVLLVLFAFGLPFAIQPLLQSFALHPVSGVLGVFQIAAQITAFVLLFRPESNAWFRGRKPPSTQHESVEF